LSGYGMSDMVVCIEDALADLLVQIEVVIPYSEGSELSDVHEQGNVEVVDYREGGTYVRALVPQSIANRLEKYNVHATQLDAKTADENDDGIDWVALGRGRH
jgi:50S ribosomal subunit-associated GTPase HflX